MKLIVTGSADAFNAAGRGHSCFWLEGMTRQPLMVDFGATALLALRRLRLDPRRLRTILITHLHGDHIGGLPFLTIDGMFHQVRHEPLRLIGPRGTRERVEALMRVTYGSAATRDKPFEMEFEEIDPGQVIELDGARVRSFRADHVEPPEQALGFRVEREGGPSVVFSGDTAMTDDLLRAAVGAEVLVAECSAMAPPAGKHCTWTEWQQVLAGLSVGRLLLVHLPEEVREALPRAPPSPGPEVSLAEDGQVIELDAE